MSRSAALVLNGGGEPIAPFAAEILAADMIVAVDGGATALSKCGIVPQAIVGDFDSFLEAPKAVQQLTPDRGGTMLTNNDIVYWKFPRDKDLLDTEIGIQYALEHGATTITLYGARGNRLDHELGTLSLLYRPSYAKQAITIRTSHQRISYETGTIQLTGHVGETISLLPIAGPVRATACAGLRYNLCDYEMSMTTNCGVSNEFSTEVAHITLETGGLLIVRQRN